MAVKVSSFSLPKSSLSSLVKVEIGREGSSLKADYEAAATRMADFMIGTSPSRPKSSITEVARELLIESVDQGLGAVHAVMKTGISTGYKPLTPGWVRRKQPQSKSLFWKNKGNLSRGFTQFKKGYLNKMSGKGRNNSVGVIVTTRGRRLVVGKPYRYDIRFTLPEHAEGFTTELIASSFAKKIPHVGVGYSDWDHKGKAEPNMFAKIGYLEGEGQSHRPFIAKLMADRGKLYDIDVKWAIANAAQRISPALVSRAR